MFTFSYVNRYTKNHNCPVSSSFVLFFSGAPHPEAHRLRARRAPPPGSGPLHSPRGLDCGGGRVLRGGRGGSGAFARRQRAPRGFAGASFFCCGAVFWNYHSFFMLLCLPVGDKAVTLLSKNAFPCLVSPQTFLFILLSGVVPAAAVVGAKVLGSGSNA